jgi:hypothetical protein
MSRFCIPKKFIQREINKVDKVIWETFKHTHIVEQCELEKQDEEQDYDKKVFYTPLESPSQIVITKKCLEFGVYGQQSLTAHHAKLMTNLH